MDISGYSGMKEPDRKVAEQDTVAKSIPAQNSEAGHGIRKNAYLFEWTLAALVVIIVAVGGYESFTEKYYPALSILKALHSYGYFKEYPILYEPSKGIWHLIGWTGSAMMVVMMLYSVRKRVGALNTFGSMRHWLHAHMFLGIVGPLLVTLHTTFKFNGLIATSFWCMIVTMVFGILGRYIYVQIPRSITGAELGVKEIEKEVEELDMELGASLSRARLTSLLGELGVNDAGRYIQIVEREKQEAAKGDSPLLKLLDEIQGVSDSANQKNVLLTLFFMFKTDLANIFRIMRLKGMLSRKYRLDRGKRKEITAALKKKALLIRRKNFLFTSHKLLHHWHVLHVPLAAVMFLIMFLHIIVYYMFRAVI